MAFEERRQNHRSRVIYGGTLAFNRGQSTLSCVVTNCSEFGAKVVLESTALLPDRFDFKIERKGRSFVADLIWRNGSEAGLSFEPEMATNGTISLDWARRLRDCEKDRHRLRARINQLTSEQ